MIAPLRPRKLYMLLSALAIAAFANTAQADSAPFAEAVEKAHKSGKPEIRLGDLTTFKWSRMCFYGGYQQNKPLRISNGEDDWVILFYRGYNAVGRAEGRRTKLFIRLRGKATPFPPCYGPDRMAKLHTERGITHITLTDAMD